MIDEQKLLEEVISMFPKPEGGCVVFSAAESSAIDTLADSTQPLTWVWLRAASRHGGAKRPGTLLRWPALATEPLTPMSLRTALT